MHFVAFCRVLHAIPVIEYLHRADTADGDVVPVPADRQVARSALVLANCYLDILTYQKPNLNMIQLRAFSHLALAGEVNEIALSFVLVQRRVGYYGTA